MNEWVNEENKESEPAHIHKPNTAKFPELIKEC